MLIWNQITICAMMLGELSEDINLVTLIRANEDCVLNSNSTIIKLRESKKFAKHTSYKKNITIPFSADGLNLLQDHLLPLQKHINSGT